MKTIYAIIAAAVISLAAGCYSQNTTAGKFGSGFSDETYVWEQYQQSTNRVNTIIR